MYVSLFLQRAYKITKSFLSSSCLSVCPPKYNTTACTGRIFMKFYIWGLFPETPLENWNIIKIRKNYPILYMNSCVKLWQLADILLQLEKFRTKVVENTKKML